MVSNQWEGKAQSTAQSKCFPDEPAWVRGPLPVSDATWAVCVRGGVLPDLSMLRFPHQPHPPVGVVKRIE